MKFLGVICANIIAALGFVYSSHAAGPVPSADLVDERLIAEIRSWVEKPVTLISLRAQNERHANLSAAEIDALDEEWRGERELEVQPLIAQVMGSPLSNYLTQIQAASTGLYTEIFVMDAKGLNVGQSSVTSDFWQGDEAKWQKTFAVAPDAVFVDEVEFHEGTQTHRVQISLSIPDPGTGRAIGVITVEVNLTELQRRRTAQTS